MALPPQKFREIVFQVLYSQGFTSIDPENLIPFMMNELKVTRRVMLDVHNKVDLVIEKLLGIDEQISAAATEYSFERISRVERTILRLAVFELLHDSTIPPKVAIAEAVRLCRKFGTPESSQFVNAVLDTILKKVGDEPAISNEPAPI